MKTSSCKAKGRLLQNKVRDLLLSIFPTLEPDDVRSVAMGQQGEDVQLSPAARKLFSYSIECKNTEKINVWEAFEQASTNSPTGTTPLLIFKRNKSKIMACLEFDVFLQLTKENYELKERLKNVINSNSIIENVI
jgi:hypothetical protein